ncbi:hypothetical protein CRYUN_Cryun05aG0043200 [Craigia yunnanensis]
MPDDHLHGHDAYQIAKGIQFLHTGIVPGIYSNNLKITDILMDQNLVAKISSYNLPVLAESAGKVGHGTSALPKDPIIATDDATRRSIADPAVQTSCSDQSLKKMMEMCVRCPLKDPAERPSVEDVLWNLQFAAQVQDAW